MTTDKLIAIPPPLRTLTNRPIPNQKTTKVNIAILAPRILLFPIKDRGLRSKLDEASVTPSTKSIKPYKKYGNSVTKEDPVKVQNLNRISTLETTIKINETINKKRELVSLNPNPFE